MKQNRYTLDDLTSRYSLKSYTSLLHYKYGNCHLAALCHDSLSTRRETKELRKLSKTTCTGCYLLRINTIYFQSNSGNDSYTYTYLHMNI